MTDQKPPLLFALKGTQNLGARIAAHLDLALSPLEERDFEDGEHKLRPLAGVRGRDVYVIHSLYGDEDQSVNDKLCKLLFFLATLHENGAARVTAVIPYLAYARKDRQTKAHDPVTTRTIAQLIEATGASRVIGFEVHNIVAFQNAFRCPSVHLDSRQILLRHMLPRLGAGPVAVVSPDIGGVKRAQLFQDSVEAALGHPVGNAILEKRRSGGVVSGHLFAGDVKGATVLVIDDMIASGGTMARAARSCLEHGAKTVYALAAHGLFVGDAGAMIGGPELAETIVSDSVRPFRLAADVLENNVEIVSCAPLLAAAIGRCHAGNPISDLLTERP